MSQHLAAMVEPYEAVIPEIRPLLERHWEEIALDQEQVKLDPDWARYRNLDAIGALSVMILRANGVMVGYCVMIVQPELHYRLILTATMDIFWVAPEVRGMMGGLRLFRAVEAEMKRRGVKRIYMGSKLHKDSSRLFLAMGYKPIETWFSKMLAED